MKLRLINTALLASVIATAFGAIATDALAQGRSVPTFTRDANWPQVPPQWKAGDVSSIAINAQGQSFVLSRPRTLKPEDASKAAPPVMVFEQDGKFVKSWAAMVRAMNGSSASTASRSTAKASSGSAATAARATGCPA